MHYLILVTDALIKGGCFCWLAMPFLKRKSSAVCGGAAYFLAVLLFYAAHLSLDAYVIYGMGSLAMFLAVCGMDRRNYRQKLFLVVTFFSLSWFASAMAEIMYDHLCIYIGDMDYMQNHPDLLLALYIVAGGVYLVLVFLFMVVSAGQFRKAYANKGVDMGQKELLMLSLPSVVGVTGYEIMRYYRVFYAVKIGRPEVGYDALELLFCVVAVVTVIVVIMLYQELKARQEENLQARLLATQMEGIRQHIERVESLYRDIRGVKHDMANHVLTLERLYAGNMAKEAQAYSKALQDELAQASGGINSGNPVTDIILQEFRDEAVKEGISFCTEFSYPTDSGINAFDISVILNNALQNALEHTVHGEMRRVCIGSYRRNNAYMIEVRNSFAGSLQWDADSGLPLTSKEKKDNHGFGLSNIRRVARKYAGDIDIVLEDGEFCLCIMLMAG
ncbi:MAG: GHKL domain-containing protein [Lachnospiraceae bacterium]|nr:GHKL domain-containing protein [Lachnospiraceae bacterium]